MTFLSRPEGRLIWRMDNSRAWRFAPAQFRPAEVRQNSNFDIFANGGENSDGKALRIDTAIMQGKNLLYECWGPSFFPYGSNTTGAPTAWPGLMLAFVLPYGSEGWTRHVKYAFELSGDIYYMTYKNGIIDKNWTKIAGPA